MDNITELWKSIVRLAVKQARQVTDDKEALAIKILYKQWVAQLGRTLEVGEYVQHNGELYRVLQQHIVQENWVPGIGTESLYMIIDREHEGTLEAPIPWRGNMECFVGKYYIEDEVLYECIRDSGIALHHKASELIDNYFSIYNENVEDEDENVESGDSENTEGENDEENNNNNDENIENGNEEDDNDNNEEDEPFEPEDNPNLDNGENEGSIEDGNENIEDDDNEEDVVIPPEDNPDVDGGEDEENTEDENENIETPKEDDEIVEPEVGDGKIEEDTEVDDKEEPKEEPEIGSLENPIDVTNATFPIVYELDRYYKEGEVVYKCIRGETLYFLPSSLVGHFFEIA